MNKAFILQILALSGEFIHSVTPEWCTVMQSVYKTRIVTVQDTVQQIRRHYFWRNSFENIPINYTRIEHYIDRVPQRECCSGYKQQNNECVPVCHGKCPNHSTCTRPDYCQCDNGYLLNYYEECEPICEPSCHENAYCASFNRCVCQEGFEWSEEGTQCKAICSKGCPENAECLAPEQCQCKTGYQMKLSSQRIQFCEPICEQDCSTFGKCVAPNKCECEQGFEMKYRESSDEGMVGKCEPICSQSCDHGQCVAPELCKCDEGYLMDERGKCQPTCSKPCLFGVCSAPDTCKCLEGYRLTGNDLANCEPICEPPCVNAACAAPNFCICHLGYKYKALDLFQECVESSTTLLPTTTETISTSEESVSVAPIEQSTVTILRHNKSSTSADCLSNCQCWQEAPLNATAEVKECIAINVTNCLSCNLATKRLECVGSNGNRHYHCLDWEPIAADLLLQQDVKNTERKPTRLWLWLLIPLFISITVLLGAVFYVKQFKNRGNYSVGYKIGGLH